MAGADYYSCDICGNKTFYDADLYDGCVHNQNPDTGRPWPDGNIGWMVVICPDCANKHKIKIVSK